MAEKTWAVGEKVTAANVNTYLNHTGGAWNAWTPVIVQGATPSINVNFASYFRVGRMITYSATVSVTATPGTAATVITFSLPVTAAAGTTSGYQVVGLANINDTSTSTHYQGFLVGDTTTTVKALTLANANSLTYLGSTDFTAALANTDTVSWWGTYQAATG